MTTRNAAVMDRFYGCAIGAALGDAFGMPLEFRPPNPPDRLVRTLISGRLPAGSFTDDTEMALALAESLIYRRPLDGDDLAQRFVTWMRGSPPDIGIHTAQVLGQIASGSAWQDATENVRRSNPSSASNGSVMRCWPVALAWWDQPAALEADSELQSRVTHPHSECVSACVFINTMIAALVQGSSPNAALEHTLSSCVLPPALGETIRQAPAQHRAALKNSGWVRHTVESVVWGLMTTGSFEEAVIQVANLGADADTAASVVGALAGAAYGLNTIPPAWVDALQGEYPLGSGVIWRAQDFIQLVDRLVA